MFVCTSSAMTGRKMIMVAVLLANSVKQAMKAVMSMTATAGGTWARGCKWFPIHTANPDSYCQKKKKSLCLKSRLGFSLTGRNVMFRYFHLF